MGQYGSADFSELQGKTISRVSVDGNSSIDFELESGERYRLYHYQDCCENVTIEDICGDIQSIVGSPVLLAEEATNHNLPARNEEYHDDSWTWTFYKIRTMTGDVTIRWYGESNGYYSESVTFEKVSR